MPVGHCFFALFSLQNHSIFVAKIFHITYIILIISLDTQGHSCYNVNDIYFSKKEGLPNECRRKNTKFAP